MIVHRQGFTLLELVAAMSIMVLIVGATVLVVNNLASARQRTATESLIQQEARAAAGAIVTALRNAHRGQQSRELLLEGVSDPTSVMPTDSIRFFTVSHRAVRMGEPESDVREVSFFLSSANEGEMPMLMVRMDPTLNEPLDEGGVVERVAGHIVGLRIAYHDGEGWLDHWDAQQRSWPLAVRVEVAAAESEHGRVHVIRRMASFPHQPASGRGGGRSRAMALGVSP